MTIHVDLPPAESDPARRAAAEYLAPYKDWSRVRNDCDLRCYLAWCADWQLPPLTAQRAHVELSIRWMQEVPRLAPATVARRVSVVGGFYRTCVIDGILEHSPADYVRRPRVLAESPTLGLTHLQFEALLATARSSVNPYDFALICLLGLLGLRVFEATGSNLNDLGEEHGHRVLRVRGKGGKGRPDVTTMPDAGVDLRDVQIAARHADPRTTMRYDRARNNLDRHPNHLLAAYMASGT